MTCLIPVHLPEIPVHQWFAQACLNLQDLNERSEKNKVSGFDKGLTKVIILATPGENDPGIERGGIGRDHHE
jgi:hypothetical protein